MLVLVGPFQRTVGNGTFQHAAGVVGLFIGSVIAVADKPRAGIVIHKALHNLGAGLVGGCPRHCGGCVATCLQIFQRKHPLHRWLAVMAAKYDDTFAAEPHLAQRLFVPVFHTGASRCIGPLGVDKQLVQIGAVVVVRGGKKKPFPAFGGCRDRNSRFERKIKYILRICHLHPYLSGSSKVCCSCRAVISCKPVKR